MEFSLTLFSTVRGGPDVRETEKGRNVRGGNGAEAARRVKEVRDKSMGKIKKKGGKDEEGQRMTGGERQKGGNKSLFQSGVVEQG